MYWQKEIQVRRHCGLVGTFWGELLVKYFVKARAFEYLNIFKCKCSSALKG